MDFSFFSAAKDSKMRLTQAFHKILFDRNSLFRFDGDFPVREDLHNVNHLIVIFKAKNQRDF